MTVVYYRQNTQLLLGAHEDPCEILEFALLSSLCSCRQGLMSSAWPERASLFFTFLLHQSARDASSPHIRSSCICKQTLAPVLKAGRFSIRRHCYGYKPPIKIVSASFHPKCWNLLVSFLLLFFFIQLLISRHYCHISLFPFTLFLFADHYLQYAFLFLPYQELKKQQQ